MKFWHKGMRMRADFSHSENAVTIEPCIHSHPGVKRYVHLIGYDQKVVDVKEAMRLVLLAADEVVKLVEGDEACRKLWGAIHENLSNIPGPQAADTKGLQFGEAPKPMDVGEQIDLTQCYVEVKTAEGNGVSLSVLDFGRLITQNLTIKQSG